MKVITVEDIEGTPRERVMRGERGRARCYLAAEDGCGFSFSTVTADKPLSGMPLQYRHHVEVNYILEGSGAIENLETGESWPAGPGMLYVVGPADRHRVRLAPPVRVVSLFNPPILGNEMHDEAGGYPPSGEIPNGWGPAGGGPGSRRMFVKQPEEIPVVTLGDGRSEARRYLTLADDVGLTFSDLKARPGGVAELWYKNHVEANFVVAGEGEVMEHATGRTWPLRAGTLYVVGPRDRHRVSNTGGLHILSIFNPPLVGNETHDADGSYPPTGEVPAAWR